MTPPFDPYDWDADILRATKNSNRESFWRRFVRQCFPQRRDWIRPKPLPRRNTAPVIQVVMETVSKNLTGTKSVNVKRIEMEDDGSFTVVLPWYTGPQED